MTIVTYPHEYISDLNGTPLDSGKMYLGTAAQDPETNPIQAYWDSGLTTPASQPITISAGYVVNAGARATVYVSPSAYSVRIRNRADIQVDYNANVVDEAQQLFEQLSDDLAAPTGSSLVGFIQAGTGAVARTAQAKLRESVTVQDFGAVGDGTGNQAAAINSALARGGVVRINGAPGSTYRITDRMLVTEDDTIVIIDAGVTIDAAELAAAQSPFGSAILVTGENCAIIGHGVGSSWIRLTGGSYANAITFLHCGGGSVRHLSLDGGKDSVVVTTDDTFGTGVMFINDSGSNPGGSLSKGLVDDVEISDFAQYAAQAYGDQAEYCTFRRLNIHDIGIGAQTDSRGSAFAFTRGIKALSVEDCFIADCKEAGIFATSAGVASSNLSFKGNTILRCGMLGIRLIEDEDRPSIAGVGMNGILIADNIIKDCGQGSFPGVPTGGILAGTFNDVGVIVALVSRGNLIQGNTGNGWTILTNDDPTSRTGTIDIDDMVIDNDKGIVIGENIDATVRWNAAKVFGNTADVEDNSDQSFFTPVIIGITSAGVGTYTTQNGRFERIGRRVFFDLEVTWSAHTGTGDMRLGGFPVASVVGEPLSVAIDLSSALTITGQAVLVMQGGQTYADVFANNNGALAPLAMDTAASLRVSGSYRTV